MSFIRLRVTQVMIVIIIAAILAILTNNLWKFHNSIHGLQQNIGTTPHEIRYQIHQSINQVTLLDQEMRFRKRHNLPYNSRSMINRIEQLKFRAHNIRAIWDVLDSNLDKSSFHADIDAFQEQLVTLDVLLHKAFDDEAKYMRDVSDQVIQLKIVNAEMFSNGSKFLKLHTANYVSKLSTIATAINILIAVFVALFAILSYALILIFKQRNKLNQLSTEDPLTKLYNRRLFNTHLEEAIERYKDTRSPLTLIIFDVDFFKAYNDHLGHAKGDQALKEIADGLAALKKEISELESYRVGGEEFASIYTGLEYDDGLSLAEKLRTCIEGLNIPHGNSPISDFITISVGVVSANQMKDTTLDTLYSAADQALYEAKEIGRNRSCLFNPSYRSN